jgi:transposase
MDANDRRSSQNENGMQNVGDCADRLKILAWDGSGLVLFWKRLEHGAFRWPPISDGVMRLSASQLAALVDGLDWSRLHARDVPRPTAAS